MILCHCLSSKQSLEKARQVSWSQATVMILKAARIHQRVHRDFEIAAENLPDGSILHGHIHILFPLQGPRKRISLTKTF